MAPGLFFGIATAFLLLAAVVSLLFVGIAWSSCSKYFGAPVSKSVEAACSLVSSTLGVLAKVGGFIDEPYATTSAVLALISIFVWKCVDLYSGSKRDAERRNYADEIERKAKDLEISRMEILIRSRLLGILGQLLCTKKQRIAERLQAASASESKNRSALHVAGLSPDDQLVMVLQHLTTFLHQLLPGNLDSVSQNFRVALYVAVEGVMVPRASWNHLTKQKQFLSSYKEQSTRPKFRLDCGQDPACAVRCIQEGKLVIVADCASVLTYYREEQKNYLKSLVAFPLSGYVELGGREVKASLVVDTDVANHFTEADRPTIEAYLTQFALRIELESAILALLSNPKGLRNVHQPKTPKRRSGGG